MTPAIDIAKRAAIAFHVHEYAHDPATASYGMEAADKLGVEPERVFKTLVVALEGQGLAVAVVPVTRQLSLKQVAKSAGAKKATMAQPQDVQRATGYVLGGVSPLGQKKRLATYIDLSAQPFATILVSAGRRGLEIELSPAALADLTRGRFTPLTQ
ncbi:Cys-tRNA(Pro) deacylase [Halomonas sp. Bachu 37]|uniref:Cys-tRNA(Pro) deacylase n=1 Tax=Halomonas kashgarensis TaxID=3084920 RepID=UPI003217C463